MDELTHFNQQNRAKMVDVSDKTITTREATAEASIRMKPETLTRIQEGKIKKGDVLAVAQVAGIMAAKKTHELIPMCHMIGLSSLDITFTDNGCDTITITATAKAADVTGVEMESMTACMTAALTIYDMCKAMDRAMVIEQCLLIEKKGGKSGHFRKNN